MRRASFQSSAAPSATQSNSARSIVQEYRRHAGQAQVKVPDPGTPQQQQLARQESGESKQQCPARLRRFIVRQAQRAPGRPYQTPDAAAPRRRAVPYAVSYVEPVHKNRPSPRVVCRQYTTPAPQRRPAPTASEKGARRSPIRRPASGARQPAMCQQHSPLPGAVHYAAMSHLLSLESDFRRPAR